MRNCKRSLSCPTASGRARLTNLRVYTGAKARPPGLRRQLTLRCENAASIAGLLLTTECCVTEVPEKEKAPMGPPGGGGYGGGMDY